MNAKQIQALTKNKTEILLDTLTHELGRNPLELAFEMYPELNDMPRAKQEEAINYKLDHVVQILEENRLLPTAENVKRALAYSDSSIMVDNAKFLEENPQAPARFTPKSAEAEVDFYNDQSTSAEAIKQYMQAKHGAR